MKRAVIVVLSVALAAAALAFGAPRPASATTSANLLQNSNFAGVGPDGPYTRCTNDAGCGNAAAWGWTMFSNGATVLTSDLVPIPTGGQLKAIHLTTNGSSSGLVQGGINQPAGTKKLVLSAKVFVVEGGLTFGYFNGTAGTNALVFNTPGTWQTLHMTVPDLPPNTESEVLLYSYGSDPYTDVYIASVSLKAIT